MEMDPQACYAAIRSRDARFDGRLFVGVRTTGIYCRPVCPARTPKQANVTFHPSAASAQAAGYRPCLRCRPETAPDLAAWNGTSTTVARALGLIEAGALDSGDVDGLASRLGVGERHLRRLFRQHLGAAPIAVAQTRRVLLAKQLIHQTRLPMTEVALAAGFGSLRRFNETFRQLYDRPPAALRRAEAAHGAATNKAARKSGDAIRLTLSYRPPYDWEAMVAFLEPRAIAGVEVISAARYARTIRLGEAAGAVAVAPRAGDRMEVAVHFPRLAALPSILARVRRLFDLAADPRAINGHLAGDPLLAPLITARPGLRVPGAWDGFELAVRAVLGQQITIAAATRLAGRLAERHGAPLAGEAVGGIDGLERLFPTAADIADADLTAFGMPRSRGASLNAIAKATRDDPGLLAPRGELGTAIQRLRAVRGVGDWTAHYIAMRQLREPDAFPAADVGLMRAVERLTGARPTAAELLARAERWRPWRAYAALHLWTFLADSQPETPR